jgi:predicted GNAT superfamily acetyltransferase
MLGVLPAYRNSGIGRKLKLRQREDAMARGIALIEWTFDPLELKNAFLNIEKLGAIVRRYHENQYGHTGSPLHGGLPTDRCYAEWWINSPRVKTILAGEPHATNPVERVGYPTDIARIRHDDAARARAIQKANGEKLRRAFEMGLAATGFERGETEGTYLLEPWS